MDTGVLIAGLYWQNEARRCLEAWHQGIFHLAVSDAVFEEYQSVAWMRRLPRPVRRRLE
jgi:predicted nucleic acid-binding protein